MSKKLQKNKRVSRVKRIKKNKRRTKRTRINRRKKTLKGGMFGSPEFAYINKEDAVFYKLDNPDEELVGFPKTYQKNLRIVYMFHDPLGAPLNKGEAQVVADNREKANGEDKVLIKFQNPRKVDWDLYAWMNKDDLVQFENPNWTWSYGKLFTSGGAGSSA